MIPTNLLMSENSAEELIEQLKNYQPFGESRNKPEIYKLWDHEKTKAYFEPEYINYSKNQVSGTKHLYLAFP